MSRIKEEIAFVQAAEFVREQDRTVQFWAGRHIVVQGGLAVAVATIYAWDPTNVCLIRMVCSSLALLAMAFNVVATLVILRECRWQALYVNMVKRAEGDAPLLFQPEYTIPGPNVPKAFTWLGTLLVVAWITVLAFLWIGPVETRSAGRLGAIEGNQGIVLGHYLTAGFCVLADLVVAFITLLLIAKHAPNLLRKQARPFILLASAAILLTAGVGRLGWHSPITTYDGASSAENLNNWLFWGLSLLGTFFLFVDRLATVWMDRIHGSKVAETNPHSSDLTQT